MSRLFIALCLSVLAGPALRASVLNGGFESGPTGVGTVPGNWTVSPGTEIFVLLGSDYSVCCGAFGSAAQLGNRFATFGAADVPNTSTLSQVITTVSGVSYLLAYDFAALGAGSQTLTASVLDGAVLLATASHAQSADPNLATTFQHYLLAFTAIGASTTLSFSVDRFTLNVDGALDNVDVTSDVPEPASWGMLLLAAGVALAARYKIGRWRQHGAHCETIWRG